MVRSILTLTLLAFFAVIFVSNESKADEPAKAPAGSQNRGIYGAAYCIDMAIARGGKFKDLFVANLQSIKNAQSKENEPESEKHKEINKLDLYSRYLEKEMTFLSSEGMWMYKMLGAIGKSVENPDPKILETGRNRGKVDGEVLSNVENQCFPSCTSG